jgi:hypothetical protein
MVCNSDIFTLVTFVNNVFPFKRIKEYSAQAHWLYLLTPTRYFDVSRVSHIEKRSMLFQNAGMYMILVLKLLRPLLLRLRERNWKQILALTVPNRLCLLHSLLSSVYGSSTLSSIPLKVKGKVVPVLN